MTPERVYSIINGPVVSEKAALVSETGNYVVFSVALNSSKKEISKAIEKIFNVKVESVRTARVKGKTKVNRFGQTKKSDVKKAYVKLSKGFEIDFSNI